MNKFILINKKQNMTSYDVIRSLKKQFNTSNIGHCGTLDPMATGLIIIAVGKQALKAIRFVNEEEKEYVATLRLGSKTITGDITGSIIQTQKVVFPSHKEITSTLKHFVGPSLQTPPFYSAKKVLGTRLYKMAYKGKFISGLKQKITINEMTLINFCARKKTITFKCHVSKGTYIRTLCEDVAVKLNNVATMIKLQRTKIGKWPLKMASPIKKIRNFSFIKIKDMINLPIVELKEEEYAKISCGQKIPGDKKGIFKVIKNDKLCAVVRVENKLLSVIRNFDCENI